MFFSVTILLISLQSASGCRPVYETTFNIRVYYGWPYTLECSKAIPQIHSDLVDIVLEYQPLECVIQDLQSGRILLNYTQNISMYYPEEWGSNYSHRVENISSASVSEYQIILKKKQLCWIVNITLDKLEAVAESCEANLERSHSIDVKLFPNENLDLQCDVPSDVSTLPGNLISRSKFDHFKAKAFWLHNCTTVLRNNSWGSTNIDLLLRGEQYSRNLGVYTCAIEYNGKTRYRIHYRVCASIPSTQILTATCNSQVAYIADKASIECNIDAGFSSLRFGFTGYFYKLSQYGRGDNERSEFRCNSIEKQENNRRISCHISGTKIKEAPCFRSIPSDEELDSYKTKFTFVYSISNVRDSDFGEFAMVFFRPSGVNVTATFTLKADPGRYLNHTQRLLTIMVVIIVGIIFMFLLLWWFADMEIRWLWYKSFKSYDKDTKTYAGYLAYHYSNGMTVTSPFELKTFIRQFKCHLQQSGAKIFDSGKDMSADLYKVESTLLKLRQCHRIIIILTPEYVKDQWGIHEAYQAWKIIIEDSGVKIIFVMLPTTMSIINDLPEDLKTSLCQAIKRHMVINWNGNLPVSKRMWRHLDLLMPKLLSHTQVQKSHSNNNESEKDQLMFTDNLREEGVCDLLV